MATLDRLSRQHHRAAEATLLRIEQDIEEGITTPDSLRRDTDILNYHRLALKSFQEAADLERRWHLTPSDGKSNNYERSSERVVCCDGERISCARVAAVHDSSGR